MSPEAEKLYKALVRRVHAESGNPASKAYDALVAAWTEDAAFELLSLGRLNNREVIELLYAGGNTADVQAQGTRLESLYRRLGKDWVALVNEATRRSETPAPEDSTGQAQEREHTDRSTAYWQARYQERKG